MKSYELNGTRKTVQYRALLLVMAVIAAALVAGCTFSMPFQKGSSPAADPSTPWSGTWDSDWGPMELSQSGNQVTGTYEHNGGRITGTLSANTLSGTWSETPTYTAPDDAGDFTFTLAADGKSFSGEWWYGSRSGKADGSWSATRK